MYYDACEVLPTYELTAEMVKDKTLWTEVMAKV